MAEELERSRRYCRALSVFVAAPRLPSNGLAAHAVASAAELLARASRGADFVGELDEGRVLIVMPETDQVEAANAAARWSNQMWWQSRAEGGQDWCIVRLDFRPGMSAEELLELAHAEMPVEVKIGGEASLADLLAALGQPAATEPVSDAAEHHELPVAMHSDEARAPRAPSPQETDEPAMPKHKPANARDIDCLRDSIRLQRARMRSRGPSAGVRAALGGGMLELMSS